MPIKIEILIEEGQEKLPSGYEAGVVGAKLHAEGAATPREKRMHDILVLAFKTVIQEEGKRLLGAVMVERDGPRT